MINIFSLYEGVWKHEIGCAEYGRKGVSFCVRGIITLPQL